MLSYNQRLLSPDKVPNVQLDTSLKKAESDTLLTVPSRITDTNSPKIEIEFISTFGKVIVI